MPVLALFAPSAMQCVAIAGPVGSVFGLIWLVRHGHEWVAAIFPHWEWERELGWLNLRAHRRADRIFRWVRYVVHAGLLLALGGIIWNAFIFGSFDEWDDPGAVGILLIHLSMLIACLAVWIVYLVTILAPRLREEYEREELERFRKENPDGAKESDFRRRGAGGITIWESPTDASPRRR
jgi:hypothetical protein